jgi:hypothetical protein
MNKVKVVVSQQERTVRILDSRGNNVLLDKGEAQDLQRQLGAAIGTLNAQAKPDTRIYAGLRSS